MWLFLSLIMVTIILFGYLIYYSYINDFLGVKISILMIILFILYGWILLGILIPVSYKIVPVDDFMVIKTNNAVIVEYDDIRSIFTDIKTYKSADSLCYGIKKGFNMYNYPLKHKTKIVIIDCD